MPVLQSLRDVSSPDELLVVGLSVVTDADGEITDDHVMLLPPIGDFAAGVDHLEVIGPAPAALG